MWGVFSREKKNANLFLVFILIKDGNFNKRLNTHVGKK